LVPRTVERIAQDTLAHLRVCLQSLLCYCNGSHEFLGRIGREMKMHHSILEVKSGMMTGSIQDLLYPKEIHDHIDCKEGHDNSLHGKWIDSQL
jgi:hypothetical protein